MNERDPAGTVALLEQLEELKALLEREFDAIRERNTADLATLTAAKQSLVDTISNTAAKMGDTLADHVEKNTSASAKNIRALITHCSKANKTNGCVIESSQSFTTSLLDVLRGRAPGERTYTARGRLGAGQNSNAFVRV